MSWTWTAIVLALLTAAVAKTTLQHAPQDILHPLVIVNGILAYFAIFPAAFLLATGRYYFRGVTTTDGLFAALSLVLLGYLLTVYGYRHAATTRVRLRLSNTVTVPGRSDVPPQRLRLLGITGFAIGGLSYTYYVLVNGGPIEMLTVTPRTAFTTVPETGRWRMLGLLGLFGGLITTLVSYWPGMSRHQLTSRDTTILASVCGTVLTAAVLTRARMVILIPIVIIFAYVYFANYVTQRQLIAGVSAVGVLVAISGFFEAAILGDGKLWLLMRGLIQTVRLEVFAGTVIQVPSQHPYAFGETLLRAPMIQWPGMPLRYGDQLEVIMIGKNRSHTTMSGMLLGELYLNWGVLGVLGGSGLFGLALGALTHLRTAQSYIARGSYPLLLIGTVLLWPTNLTWATQGIVLRLFIPLAAAITAAIIWTHHTPPEARPV
ncbi:hypothetical protein [Halomicrococcus sp. NG-SE-24]|uniref:hypothetical protein n=1 Tax=Halomicrococcus sp. NG-SE-24 TaxID=3436928 RepID=UPI003D953F5F